MRLFIRITFLLGVFSSFTLSQAQEFNNCKIVKSWDGRKVDYRWCSPNEIKPTWNKEWCSDSNKIEPVKRNHYKKLSQKYGSVAGTVWKCSEEKKSNQSISGCIPSTPATHNTSIPEENITQKIEISNPSNQWHGDGARFEVGGLQTVPTGCASSIQYTVRSDSRRGAGSTISSYAYMSGKAGRVGFEAGLANGTPVVVQNPSKSGGYNAYYGVGGILSLQKTTVESGFTQSGHVFTKFNDLGMDVIASTEEDSFKFNTHNDYQFKTLYIGIAYQNGGTPELKDGDSYLTAISEAGVQTIQCPGKVKVESKVTFRPKNRLSEIAGASQIHRFTNASGETDYVVIVAGKEEKRKQLLDQYRNIQTEGM